MKIVVHPGVDPERLRAVQAAAPPLRSTRESAQEALAAMPGADAFVGKITPAMLVAC